MPDVRQFADTYGPKGAQVIAVEDSGVAEDKVLLFKESLGVTYPIFYDPTKTALKTYGIRITSTTFIITPDFYVRERVETGAGVLTVEPVRRDGAVWGARVAMGRPRFASFQRLRDL